jgi:hypothetical protein
VIIIQRRRVPLPEDGGGGGTPLQIRCGALIMLALLPPYITGISTRGDVTAANPPLEPKFIYVCAHIPPVNIHGVDFFGAALRESEWLLKWLLRWRSGDDGAVEAVAQ